jgi:hypothetical protein
MCGDRVFYNLARKVRDHLKALNKIVKGLGSLQQNVNYNCNKFYSTGMTVFFNFAVKVEDH